MAVCIVFSSVIYAEESTDLGQLGHSYSIIEPDLIETIKSMLAKKQASGELDRLHRDLLDKGKNYVARPPGSKLSRAKEYRAFAIDPTYTLPKDIKDENGNVLYPAGFSFNPLKVKPLTRTLCFIDGDDPQQLVWLETYCGNLVGFKRILVSGDFNRVSDKIKKRIYYDQYGSLVSHFRIGALPAVVRQSGDLLYVEEFDL